MRSINRRSVRCARCQLPPRWCICAAAAEVTCPLAIDVLMHVHEQFRPSSTGNLINRVIPASRRHVWYPDQPIDASVALPGRELWILHPAGEPAPTGVPAERVEVMLIDGSWRQATGMAHAVAGWGRLVRLPPAGESRYWLRTQADSLRVSTTEALLAILRHFGLDAAADALRLQFELHVYANLRARGLKADALEFLRHSPIATAFAPLIAALDVPRPR